MRLHRFLAVTVLIAALSAVLPSAGSSPVVETGLLAELAADQRAAVAAQMTAIDKARAALGSGSYQQLVATVLRAPGPSSPRSHLDVSLDVDDAIAGLDRAVSTARRMLGPLPRHAVEIALARSVRSARAWQQRITRGPRVRAGRMPRSPEATTPRIVLPKQHDVHPSIERATAALPRAAQVIALALDRYLPVLRAHDPAPTGQSAAPCDVRDHSPYLCVSSAADHTYTNDAALIIDQGGNDVYRNSAGGAPFAPTGGAAYIPVSIVIDQAGNDVYEPQIAARQTPIGAFSYRIRIADGSGMVGGIGMVIDEAGDDVHRATAPELNAPNQYGFAALQGAGMGGFGAIVDSSGNDSFHASAPSGQNDGISLMAQGASLMTYRVGAYTAPVGNASDFAPGGAIVDRGIGNETYVMDGGHLDSSAGTGFRGALGQGYAVLGTGIVYDDGGSDSFSATTSAEWTEPTQYPDHTGAWLAPQATLLGQGYALGPVFGNTSAPKGFGLILEGRGTTTSEMTATGEGMADTDVWGQSFAGGDGLAAIDDIAGDDRYRARSSLSLDRQLAVDDKCRCDEAALGGYRGLFASMMYVQGAGGVTGEALLRDRDGNDSYVAASDASLRATVIDARTNASEPASFDVSGYGPLLLDAQGYGGLGFGVLADEAGTDSYLIRNTTEVDASRAAADDRSMIDVVSGPKANAKGQGGGEWTIGVGWEQLGALLDLGGADDRFVGSAENAASLEGGSATTTGWAWPQGFQGNGFKGLFVANGASPTIVSSPAQGVCPSSPGVRGSTLWWFCGLQGTDPDHQIYDGIPAFIAPLPQIWAAGRAPGSTALAPTLTFEADTAGSAHKGEAPVVAAKLVGADGQPIAGMPVRFDLQGSYPGLANDPRFAYFFNVFEATATTDPMGVARTVLPLNFASIGPVSSPGGWRVIATFDGADELLPAHVTRPITVVE